MGPPPSFLIWAQEGRCPPGVPDTTEESREEDAACWPAWSLPSVTTAKMDQRLGHWAWGETGPDHTLLLRYHLSLFPLYTYLPSSLGHAAFGLSVPPHTPVYHDAFAVRLCVCYSLPGRLLVSFLDQLLFVICFSVSLLEAFPDPLRTG